MTIAGVVSVPSARRCLLTGASGYLGRRVLSGLLAAGARVTAVTRLPEQLEVPAGVEVMPLDLSQPDACQTLGAEFRWDDVVHLAGTVPGRSEGFAQDAAAARQHLLLSLSLSRALPQGFGGRVVVASSMTVYGLPQSLPVREDHPLRPRFPYALGKLTSEDAWRALPGLDLWILRLPGLFSADRQGGALYHFARAALAGRPIEITAAEPTPWEILHVDDAARAVVGVLGAAGAPPGAMNVGYGQPIELERVARLIAERCGEAEVINRTGVTHPAFQLDVERLSQRLAWPPTSLERRLSEFVQELAST